ncbi:hypothetical protein ABIB75_004339 [Bradyrhizobium sp. GM2.2]
MGAVTFASSAEAGKTPGLAFHYSTHEGRVARRALVALPCSRAAKPTRMSP